MSKFDFSVILTEGWEDNAKSHHVVVEAEDWKSAREKAITACPGNVVRSVSRLGCGVWLTREAHEKWMERGDTDYLILS